jgi:cysteinyl-tRNA synthetase
MAKSTGNLVFVHDLFDDVPPEVVRLLLIDRRWDEPWEYTPEGLLEAASRLDRLQVAAGRPHDHDTARDAATAALLDDLDVPRALEVAEEAGGAAARDIGRLVGVI